MSRIRLLDHVVANQIAAGEVIQRPASVIKELLENSLDAKARHIRIKIEHAGIGVMQVSDDGRGIHPEDLPLAIQSHATSKIQTTEDLQYIQTLGFRGEALASMASVSKLRIASKCADQSLAWHLQITAGSTPIIQPTQHPIGTTIEVRDLFFNTPVRRRFLRQEKTEFLHIEATVKQMALSEMTVGFELQNEDKWVFRLPPAISQEQREKRVEKICGKEFLRQALFIEVEANGLVLKGWMGLPECARHQQDKQFFYINGRVVRDRLIQQAIRQAYTAFLAPGKYPSYVLFLTVSPDEIDVNVHPAKSEVRFHQPRWVFDFMHRELKTILSQEIPNAKFDSVKPRISVSESYQPMVEAPKPTFYFSAPNSSSELESLANTSVFDRWLGAWQHYVFALKNDRLIVFDQRRLRIESMVRQWMRAYVDKTLSECALVFPYRCYLRAASVPWFLEQQEGLNSLGLRWDRLDETIFLLRAVPDFLKECSFEPESLSNGLATLYGRQQNQKEFDTQIWMKFFAEQGCADFQGDFQALERLCIEEYGSEKEGETIFQEVALEEFSRWLKSKN